MKSEEETVYFPNQVSNQKVSFDEFSKMDEYKPLSFQERQIMYVLYNADGPLTEDEIVKEVHELNKKLKVN